MASENPPTSTTIPSETNLPSPEPSESSKPSRSTHNTIIQQKSRIYLFRRLALFAHRIDRILTRLSTLLSSPASTDNLLGTIAYSLDLLHALLSRLLARRLASLASKIAEKADDALLPGETLVASLPVSASTALLAQAAGSSKALAGVIGDFRIFVRLWGLAGIYMWARGTLNAPLAHDASTKDRLVRTITWSQIASCALFQVLENGAYLSGKGALTSSAWSGEAGKRRENRWWLWSCRFWAAHVVLELARLGVLQYYWDRSSEAEAGKEKEMVTDGEKEGKMLQAQRRRESWLWWKDLVGNCAYLPMTLHWSVEKGFLSDWGVGLLGTIASGSLLVDAWRKTA